jgi:hypothetical protein
MKTNDIILTIVLVVVVGAGAFFGGMKYQQSKQPSFAGQFGGAQGSTRNGNGNGQQGQNRFRAGGGQVSGEILSQDDKSMTVKLQDGSTKIVIFSDSTSFVKTSQGSKSDLKVGDRVAAFGAANSDGSITAQNVQLNPILRGPNASPNPGNGGQGM